MNPVLICNNLMQKQKLATNLGYLWILLSITYPPIRILFNIKTSKISFTIQKAASVSRVVKLLNTEKYFRAVAMSDLNEYENRRF